MSAEQLLETNKPVESEASLFHMSETEQTPHILANKYVIEQEIGHGAQGKIFLASRMDNNDYVVVKQLNINSIKTWKEYELFHREAEVLKSLDFEGVAKFYDSFECLEDDPPCAYIVQEYIKGVSLQKMINDGHRFAVRDVYDILIQLLSLINKLQRHNPPIIHRDIKPSNLMISADDNKKLKVTIIDFGAVANPQLKGGGSTVAGTFGYMPPEQLTGKPVPASDIYAIGALAVQMFCGKAPADIPTKDFRLIFEPEMQNQPHELVVTLRQMLEPKVEDRLADVDEIIQRFRNYRNGKFTKSSKTTKADQDAPDAYPNQYEEKLAEVSYICEPGNIEIWQQLPDNTPRSVPLIYQKVFSDDNQHDEVQNKPKISKYDDFTSRHKPLVLTEKPRNLMDLFILITSWGFLLSVIGIPISFLFMHPILIAVSFGGTFIFILLHNLLFSIIKIYRELSKKSNISGLIVRFENGLVNEKKQKRRAMIKSVINCIASGRKSIATIVGVEYQAVKSVLNINSITTVCDDPCFVVKYKFNPPDDKRSEDLIHEFVTHIEPEKHYKIGDPLPILYLIENHYFYDTVYSMPYPVALSDVAQFEDLVNWSSSKQKEVQEYSQNSMVDKLISDLKKATFDIEKRYLLTSIRSYHYQNKDIKRILRQIFEMLKDSANCGVHNTCIQVFLDLFALPSEDAYSPEDLDKTTWVRDNARQVSKLYADYLSIQPRSEASPSYQSIDEIIHICEDYKHCVYMFMPEFWDALVDVHNDPAVSPKAKKTIYQYLKKAAQSSNDMRTYFEHLQV